MWNSRDKYVSRVVLHIERELETLNKALPVALKVDSVTGTQADWKLGIGIETQAVSTEWFDLFEVLSVLGSQVNEEFKRDKWYFGIELLVPDRLLGKVGFENLKRRQQQERDNDDFRHVRLRMNNG